MGIPLGMTKARQQLHPRVKLVLLLYHAQLALRIVRVRLRTSKSDTVVAYALAAHALAAGWPRRLTSEAYEVSEAYEATHNSLLHYRMYNQRHAHVMHGREGSTSTQMWIEM